MFTPSVPRRRFAAAVATVLALAATTAGVTAPQAQAVIPTSACTISAPLTPRYPSSAWGDSIYPSFVQFQVNNGNGTYAGVVQTRGPLGLTPNLLQLIYYSSGHVRFLDTYNEVGSTQFIDETVKAIGFDAQGDVVARMQKPGTDAANMHDNGWRYDLLGHKWLLQDSPLWTSVEPVGVSGSGIIIGNARHGSVGWGTNQVVAWIGTGRGTVHLLTPLGYTALAVDQRGDIFYRQDSSGALYARQPDGTTVPLRNFLSDPAASLLGGYVLGASATSAFGYAMADPSGDIAGRWTTTPGSSAPVSPRTIGYLVWVDSVGLNNDVVGEYPGNPAPYSGTRVLVRSTGKAYRLPPQFHPPYENEPHTTVNRYGQVVYTGTDGLPHLFTCPA